MKTIKNIIMTTMFLLSGCYSEGNPDFEDTGLQFYKPGNEIVVVVLGDSRFWEGGIWDHLPYTIYNYSYPGITTAGAINRVKDIAVIPDIILVGTGVNDQCIHGYNQFVAYYDHLMDLLSGHNIICLEVTDPSGVGGDFILMNDYLVENYSESFLELNVTIEETRDGCHFLLDTYIRLSELIENKVENILFN